MAFAKYLHHANRQTTEKQPTCHSKTQKTNTYNRLSAPTKHLYLYLGNLAQFYFEEKRQQASIKYYGDIQFHHKKISQKCSPIRKSQIKNLKDSYRDQLKFNWYPHASQKHLHHITI